MMPAAAWLAGQAGRAPRPRIDHALHKNDQGGAGECKRCGKAAPSMPASAAPSRRAARERAGLEWGRWQVRTAERRPRRGDAHQARAGRKGAAIPPRRCSLGRWQRSRGASSGSAVDPVRRLPKGSGAARRDRVGQCGPAELGRRASRGAISRGSLRQIRRRLLQSRRPPSPPSRSSRHLPRRSRWCRRSASASRLQRRRRPRSRPPAPRRLRRRIRSSGRRASRVARSVTAWPPPT